MKRLVKFNSLIIVVFMICVNTNAHQTLKMMVKDSKE
jgi:hypothetical protein